MAQVTLDEYSSIADGTSANRTEVIVAVTPQAMAIVQEAVSNEDGSETLALWIEIAGTGPSGFTYDIYFSEGVDASDGDACYRVGDIDVVVPSASIGNLRGATLDVSADDGETGLIMVNPNKPAGQGLPEGLNLDNPGLDTEIGKLIAQVLEELVNPSIASHGGRADLVAVAPYATMDADSFGTVGGDAETTIQTVAFVRLSGGCQGCAMSRATLSQGIQVAIQDAVPQVVSVVDVTDHALGANPYF